MTNVTHHRFAKAALRLILAAAISMLARPAWAQSDIATVKSRMLADAVDNAGFKLETDSYWGTDLSQVNTYLNSMASNGSWSDIAYSDSSNNFPALKQLDRVLVMAYTYNKSGAALYKSASLLSAINKALGYWYQVNPRCSNWFKNDIAKQFYLGPIGLLMQSVIDGTYLSKITGDLTDAPSMTGANRSALSTSVIYRAVIEGNTSRLASGAAGVASVITITTGDGIQRDNSFQQHGGILYNGNYGFAFLRDVTWVGAMLTGTQYAFSSAQVALLRDNYLQGTRWMIRGGLLDYNVRGREVGNLGGANLKAADFEPILKHFMAVDAANQSAYQASKDAIVNLRQQPVSGARHYWNSDYTAVQRAGYLSSVKMCSKRTIGTERDVNTENLLGYWLPYGLTYTYQRGDEFNYIFPIWDWARLPGVTNPHVEVTASESPGGNSQSTSFVGGATEGTYAATGMDFSMAQTQAKKSWFWFNKEWVALGAGIQSTNSHPVFSNIQQVLLKGSVLVDGTAFSGAAKAFTNPTWALHDGVGYVFPEAQTVQVQVATQTGSVKRIFGLGSAATVTGSVFSLWFDHGTAPKGKTYQYIVVPGITQPALDQYSKNIPVTVLSNTASVQAVTHKNLRVTGSVFFQAGSVSVPGGPSVKVDSPCIVVLNEPTGTVALSDPNESLSKVNLTITNVSGSTTTQPVSLPSGDSAGKSVLVTGLLDKRLALEDGGGGAAAGGASSAGDTLGGSNSGGATGGGNGEMSGAPSAGGSGTESVSAGSGAMPMPSGGLGSSAAGTADTSAAPDSSGSGCSMPRRSATDARSVLFGLGALFIALRRVKRVRR